MTREEFSQRLVEAKEKANVRTKDLVFQLQMYPSEIYRFEHAKFSYSTTKCFAYLKAVGFVLQVSKGKKRYKIDDNEKLLAWMKAARGETSMQSFSIGLGFNKDYIGHIESGRNIMSIDKFLKIAEFTGYTISLVGKDEQRSRSLR